MMQAKVHHHSNASADKLTAAKFVNKTQNLQASFTAVHARCQELPATFPENVHKCFCVRFRAVTNKSDAAAAAMLGHNNQQLKSRRMVLLWMYRPDASKCSFKGMKHSESESFL